MNYIHTINGHPAKYWEGEQICFLGNATLQLYEMADSLRQIKRERKLSNDWRETQGFERILNYGYFRINIDL